MGVENFVKCEDSMDKHVGAFETCDGKIQNINCQDATRQCFCCSSKVEFRPLL
jgi:hypothetical protein